MNERQARGLRQGARRQSAGPMQIGALMEALDARAAGAARASMQPAARSEQRVGRSRRRALRKVGPELPYIPDWMWARMPEEVVVKWLDEGWESEDPLWRQVAIRFRRTFCKPGGGIDTWERRRIIPIAGLALTLWRLALQSHQPGYAGFVMGLSRGVLAMLIPHRGRDGEPFHVDTITRYLRELRELLWGVLDFWQPSPEEAVAHGLPVSTQYFEGGARLHQALNIYKWRDPKNSVTPIAGAATNRPDPGSGYPKPSETDRKSGGLTGEGKESPRTATVDPAPNGRLPMRGSWSCDPSRSSPTPAAVGGCGGEGVSASPSGITTRPDSERAPASPESTIGDSSIATRPDRTGPAAARGALPETHPRERPTVDACIAELEAGGGAGQAFFRLLDQLLDRRGP